MTPDELVRLLQQYRAGLEAELTLLHQLREVSDRQQTVTREGNFTAFDEAADGRDAIMRSLVTLEEALRGVRQTLVEHREQAMHIEGFESVAAGPLVRSSYHAEQTLQQAGERAAV